MNASPLRVAPYGKLSVRVLFAFTLVTISFGMAIVFCAYALHVMSSEHHSVQELLVPSELKLGQLRATQGSIATLIDGISDEREPKTEHKLLLNLHTIRTSQLQYTRKSFELLASSSDQAVQRAGESFLLELRHISAPIPEDKEIAFQSLHSESETLNHALVTVGAREHDFANQLRILEGKLTYFIKERSEAILLREQNFLYAILASTLLALCIGLMMAIYTRRLLLPLARLTQRAHEVAQGNLDSKSIVTSEDELGILELNFEHMVNAIRRERERAVSNESFAAIGKMAAHVTHEIRNPLSAMSLNLELLEEELALSSIQESPLHLLAAVRREALRLEQLSEEYLRLAKLPSPRMEKTDLLPILEDLVLFVRPEFERASCKLQTQFAPHLPLLYLDESQLKQAIQNLLRNAREASPQGGVVLLSAHAEGLSIHISIEDEGLGIPDQIRMRVFDPFFSTKGEGTGLGLAITKQIVEAHEGTLNLSERTPQGTIFTIVLPLAFSSSNKLQSEPLSSSRDPYDPN